MLIIVEGIDRVGKTTLCNALSNALNTPIYKHNQIVMRYSEMDNINETDKMLQLVDLCRITDGDIIFDRFHLSDYVYGVMERGYDIDTALQHFKMIDEALSKMKAILILVEPTDIEMSSAQHGKDLSTYAIRMHMLYHLSNVKKYSCNYTNIEEMVNTIKTGGHNETI